MGPQALPVARCASALRQRIEKAAAMIDPAWWPRDAQTREELLRFLLNFARFEYALKSGGLGRVVSPRTPGETRIEPDWRGLKSALTDVAVPGHLGAAHRYLRDQPPYRQTNRDSWSPLAPAEGWGFLIDCVRTVWDNLFAAAAASDRERDNHLIRYGTDILLALIDVGPEAVRQRFYPLP